MYIVLIAGMCISEKQTEHFYRSVNELERLSKDLKAKIREIERQFGTVQKLRQELKEKESKCGKDFHLALKIEKSYQVSYYIFLL